jgi:hypothetical protein
VILAAITIPLHALVLRRAPERQPEAQHAAPSSSATDALRTRPFWLLSTSYFLATFIGIAMTVLGIPFLLERGYSAPFAAFAVGLIGISQIPGRAVFAALAARLPASWTTAGVFALIALGIGVVVGIHGTAAVIAGLVLLGMGNGMTTLSRATLIADRYGAAAYGTIGGVAAALTTGARAAGPLDARRARRRGSSARVLGGDRVTDICRHDPQTLYHHQENSQAEPVRDRPGRRPRVVATREHRGQGPRPQRAPPFVRNASPSQAPDACCGPQVSVSKPRRPHARGTNTQSCAAVLSSRLVSAVGASMSDGARASGQHAAGPAA